MKRPAPALPGRAKFAAAAGTLGIDAPRWSPVRGDSNPPPACTPSDLAARLLIGTLFTPVRHPDGRAGSGAGC